MAAEATTLKPEPKAGHDFSHLNKVQKIAALLVMLGADSAAPVLKGFPPHDVEAISAEMAKLEIVPHDLQQYILEEFSAVALEAGTAARGGIEFTRTTLEKAVGQFRANDVINRVAPTRAPLPVMHSIADMEARQLCNLVCYEQPQTIALVLSYLTAEKSAEICSLLSATQRDQVLERLATLAPTPVEVVEKVIEVLRAKAGTRQTRALNQSGGVKTAADILNAMDKAHSKELLANIEKTNPTLTRAIKQKMFTFDDLAMVEVSSLQMALRDVDMRDLAISLKGAGEKVKSILLGSLSKRAADSVREEIAFLAAVKQRDIEAAQLRIIDAVRRVENESEAATQTQQEGQHVAV